MELILKLIFVMGKKQKLMHILFFKYKYKYKYKCMRMEVLTVLHCITEYGSAFQIFVKLLQELKKKIS